MPDNSASDDLRALEAAGTPQDDALAILESQNAELRDARLEERFCWILLSTILFDVAVFATVSTTGVPLAILALELLLVLRLAHKCGVSQIIVFVDRVIDGMMKRSKDSG